jgi:hypothetical protein
MMKLVDQANMVMGSPIPDRSPYQTLAHTTAFGAGLNANSAATLGVAGGLSAASLPYLRVGPSVGDAFEAADPAALSALIPKTNAMRPINTVGPISTSVLSRVAAAQQAQQAPDGSYIVNVDRSTNPDFLAAQRQ